ncbi:zinc finger, CCHC-type containing protein [Tanacetum coccineum]
MKKILDYSLTYTGYPSVLEGCTDASWISNTKDNLSTNDWVFLLGGGAISWASKKQTCITGSIMESEFMALATAGNEAEWLRNLILDIPLWSKPIAIILSAVIVSAILAKMCLEPAEKEDEVFTSQWFKFLEKSDSQDKNKEEPPMYSNGLKGSILRTP